MLLRLSMIVFVFALVAGCRDDAPTGEIMLVLDGTLRIPDDIDWMHLEVRSPDLLVHSGDYPLGEAGFALPSTLGLCPSEGGKRAFHVRVVGRSGGVTGRVRLLREARTQIPAHRIAALPMNLTPSCLDFVKDPTSLETESSCGSGRTCINGACAPVDVAPGDLPDYAPGVSHKEDDAFVDVSSPSVITRENGERATITVRLRTKPRGDVLLPISSSRTTEGVVAPASLTFTPENWDTPQAVELVGVDDDVADGDVAYAVVLAAMTSTDSRYQDMDPADVAATNIDDDEAGLLVTPTAGLVTSEAGGTATFSLSLRSQPTADVTVPISTSDATEGTTSVTELVFTPQNWSSAQTVVVTGVSDQLLDDDQPYTVILGTATSADTTYQGMNPPDVALVNASAGGAPLALNPSGYGVGSFPSLDGRFVALITDSEALLPSNTNGTYHVFVYDRETGATELVDVSSGGVPGDENSYQVWAPSDDGRFVAYSSSASNLVPGDTNGRVDVFVRDRLNGTTERVSVASSGAEANGDTSTGKVALSRDGRYVCFHSDAPNLVAGDTNNMRDVFVHDRINRTTFRVSVSSSGQEGNGESTSCKFSSDAALVVFDSVATNLVAGDTNGFSDVFVHRIATATTMRVSVTNGGAQLDDASSEGSFAANGNLVVFQSSASNAVANDTNNSVDVFVRDVGAGSTTRVSVSSTGAEGNSHSSTPSISDDGRWVLFESIATNLVSDDSNGVVDVALRDRQTGTTTLVSRSVQGLLGNGQSYFPNISGDGRYATFFTRATNLTATHGDPTQVLVKVAP